MNNNQGVHFTISLPEEYLSLPGIQEWLLKANIEINRPENIKRILTEQRHILVYGGLE